MLKSLPFVLVLLLCLVQQSGVEAQGLVGAPVDVRYGQTSEVGRLADYGYDTARDISRLVTFVGFFTTLIRGFFSVRQKIKQSRQWLVRNASTRAAGMLVKRELGWTLLWLLAVPFVLHSLGTFAINNFGGLGGCCL